MTICEKRFCNIKYFVISICIFFMLSFQCKAEKSDDFDFSALNAKCNCDLKNIEDENECSCLFSSNWYLNAGLKDIPEDFELPNKKFIENIPVKLKEEMSKQEQE